MVSKKITTVLFDMDNTLIDWSKQSTTWHELERKHLRFVFDFLLEQNCDLQVSFEHVSTTYRERVVNGWSEGNTTLRAPHMAEIMQTTLEEFGVAFSETLTIEHVLTAYGWKGMDGVVVFPDVPDALQKLVDKGIKIGILTNAFQPMWMRDAELEHYDLLKFFPHKHTRMSAADLGYLKPHRNVFDRALSNMGATAEETIYVGDNLKADIAGAQGAGMRAVLRHIYDTPSLASSLVIPDAVIHKFDELLPLVDDWDKHIKR